MKKKILLIEDEQKLALILKNFLTNHNFIVTNVFDGEEAVTTAKDYKPDLILLDWMLPGISGLEICRQIRNIKSVRPWQFVLEPLFGYLLLAQRMWKEGKEFSEPWNFGPDETDCISVKGILEKISAEWDDGFSWKEDTRNKTHEAAMLKLDCTKAKKVLKWQSVLTFNETASMVATWYKNYYTNKKKVGDTTEISVPNGTVKFEILEITR